MSEPETVSPFAAPARDNAGAVLPPLQAHTQRPDPQPSAEDIRLWAMPAGQRGELEIADQVREAQSTVHRRQPDGTVTIEPRKPGAEPAAPKLGDQPAPAGSTHVDGETITVGDMTLTSTEVKELFQAKADAELRKTSLPATPADYKAELPADLRLPVEFKFDEADSALSDIRNLAHKKGWSQGDLSDVLGIYAGMKAQEQALFNTAAAAEVAKLGANGVQRVTALETWMRGMVGDELAGAMRGMLVTEKIVRGWETLLRKFTTQGAASFSQAHRDPPHMQGRVSEEQWTGMSEAQRLDYARQFPQPTGAR
ncbi:hypothetical protein ABIB99_001903 [Bradyrhizobium sp. LA6.1]|uniref:hypothetical protein n=1 Tax=Bradyrhizobium sp. LA6.1 TaxID=3156378 RepID=UPI0033948850